MLVAAFDSTAVTASAAVADIDENGEVRTYALFTVKNRLTHSETLLPMFVSALKTFGADASDIGLYAVSAGPGSFTGVRIGVATVKGLAMPYGTPCAGVSAPEAIAANIKNGTVCALMDARRGQFYTALFKDGERLTPDSALSAEEIYSSLPEGERITLCGDGAGLFRSLYPGDARLVPAPAASMDQNALSVAVCGWRKYKNGGAVDAAGLKPVYLRVPQAERERLERENNDKGETK